MTKFPPLDQCPICYGKGYIYQQENICGQPVSKICIYCRGSGKIDLEAQEAINATKEHQEDDRPNCCEGGNEYIRWFVNEYCHKQNEKHETLGEFTGWAMMIGWLYEDPLYYPINYCPFCGKKLEE